MTAARSAALVLFAPRRDAYGSSRLVLDGARSRSRAGSSRGGVRRPASASCASVDVGHRLPERVGRLGVAESRS